MDERVTKNLLESDWPIFLIFDHQENIVTLSGFISQPSPQVARLIELFKDFEFQKLSLNKDLCGSYDEPCSHAPSEALIF